LALTSAAPHARGKTALPFIHDDYAKALAQARARHLPIFIEAWAPW
jgi:endonuclease YncB( thermonuclease family)